MNSLIALLDWLWLSRHRAVDAKTWAIQKKKAVPMRAKCRENRSYSRLDGGLATRSWARRAKGDGVFCVDELVYVDIQPRSDPGHIDHLVFDPLVRRLASIGSACISRSRGTDSDRLPNLHQRRFDFPPVPQMTRGKDQFT